MEEKKFKNRRERLEWLDAQKGWGPLTEEDKIALDDAVRMVTNLDSKPRYATVHHWYPHLHILYLHKEHYEQYARLQINDVTDKTTIYLIGLAVVSLTLWLGLRLTNKRKDK